MCGQFILLGGAELAIAETLAIDAAPLAQNVKIDAQRLSRVLSFTASSGDLTLAGLTLQNGKTVGSNSDALETTHGGGVRFLSSGKLTLTTSTLSGNSTRGVPAFGGGILTGSGELTMRPAIADAPLLDMTNRSRDPLMRLGKTPTAVGQRLPSGCIPQAGWQKSPARAPRLKEP